LFGNCDPWADFAAADVVERVRRTTNIRPSIFEAGSACRVARKAGLLVAVGDARDRNCRFRLTGAGHTERAERLRISRLVLSTIARQIGKLLPQFSVQEAQHLRYYFMSVLDQLVVAPIHAGAFVVDATINGIVAELSAVPEATFAEALAPVPRRYQRATERLVRLAVSGDDPVLRIALAHVTGMRFCELAVAGHLRDQLTLADLERLGGVTVVPETSALVLMAETPARFTEGIRCFAEAVRAGFRVRVLLATVVEYRSGLFDGDASLSAIIRQVAHDGGDSSWLAQHRWWVARAAAAHGEADAMIREAERCGSSEQLPTVMAFMAKLRALPEELASAGVRFIDGSSVSPERSRQWRSGVAAEKPPELRDIRVVHDGTLLDTLQALRRETPLTFLVTMDRSLRAAWYRVMGAEALGQLPPTCKPGVASRLLAGLSPVAPLAAASWSDRTAAWEMTVGYLPRVLSQDLEPADLFEDDEFLVPDDGSVEGPSAARCEPVQELVDDATAGLRRIVEALVTAEEQPTQPLVEDPPAPPEPASEPVPADPAPQPNGRRASVVLVVAAVLASLGVALTGADDIFAVVLAAVAWLASGVRYFRSRDAATLALELTATTVGVWGVLLAL
jgi:hypothetical protein